MPREPIPLVRQGGFLEAEKCSCCRMKVQEVKRNILMILENRIYSIIVDSLKSYRKIIEKLMDHH